MYGTEEMGNKLRKEVITFANNSTGKVEVCIFLNHSPPLRKITIPNTLLVVNF